MTTITGITDISHIAINTADLARFRRFYEGVLGVPLGMSLRMNHPPHLRHATFHVGETLVLHVFEVPGYDPEGQGIGRSIGERGRIDHFGFLVPDEGALREVAAQLRAAGASDGEVRPLGPMLSVHATDPDGLEIEVNCPDPGFRIDALSSEVEELALPDWFDRMVAALSRGVPEHA
jgi:catechol 2,3-dioxygenase-like lactoylglutathione lyase family enzyme